MNDLPHGEPGHLNTFTRDQDSVVTGYGKHFRVVAFLPDASGLSIRVDHVHGARMPTVSEMLDVARKDQGVRGRYKLREQTEGNGYLGRSTWLEFDPA